MNYIRMIVITMISATTMTTKKEIHMNATMTHMLKM